MFVRVVPYISPDKLFFNLLFPRIFFYYYVIVPIENDSRITTQGRTRQQQQNKNPSRRDWEIWRRLIIVVIVTVINNTISAIATTVVAVTAINRNWNSRCLRDRMRIRGHAHIYIYITYRTFDQNEISEIRITPRRRVGYSFFSRKPRPISFATAFRITFNFE